MTLNPWLEEKVQEYRRMNNAMVLRANYAIAVKKGARLSWSQHLILRALASAMEKDPFLKTLRVNMDLEDSTREHLYDLHIDCVADLLQLSEEEITSCSMHRDLDMNGIKRYLKKHGYTFLPCPRRTYKIPSLPAARDIGDCDWNTWCLNPPGNPVAFDLSRPTLTGRWFDEYYARFERLDGEEKFQKEFLDVKPRFPQGGMPDEYREFFHALGNLFISYNVICSRKHISPQFFRPRNIPESLYQLRHFPTSRFLSLWKEACKVVIDVLERTNPLRHATAERFLAADMEDRLKLAEAEDHDEHLQQLMITLVELRIDMEDIISFLERSLTMPQREDPTPVNPWIAQVIMEYRKRHPDDYIRKRYVSFLQEHPEASWSDFLAAVALEYKVNREPFLRTPRREFGFSEHLRDMMNAMEIDIAADLLQFTVEEIAQFCSQEGESAVPIALFLSGHGYRLLSHPEYTLKYPLPEIEEEKKRNIEVIKDQSSTARTIMSHTDEPLKVRLEKALTTYRCALHLARTCDLPLKTQLDVLVDMGRLMEEHIDDSPELTEDAPEIAERAVYCSILVRGPKAKWTAGCHRLYGAILSKKNRHGEAAVQYIAAADIARENDGPEGLWVGKDFRSAGVCYCRIPDYRKALELFFNAETVFKKRPGDSLELEETYGNIAECCRQLGDKENEEKYRLLAASVRTTNGI